MDPMARQRTWENVPQAEWLRFMAAVHLPGVELAEKIGRFDTPFEYLRPVIGGFDDMTSFLLNRVLLGDHDAIAVRDDRIALMRHWRLGDPFPGDKDLQRVYFTAHRNEYQSFRRHHYPWIFAHEESTSPLQFEPTPETDVLLDRYICGGLADYGFTVRTRKFTKNYWRCHSSHLSRRVTIEFDKGTMTFTGMSGQLNINDLSYGLSIADPFFFSGNHFEVSKADDVHGQLHRFFVEYNRIFPHVWNALEQAIAAADNVLETLGKRSVS